MFFFSLIMASAVLLEGCLVQLWRGSPKFEAVRHAGRGHLVRRRRHPPLFAPLAPGEPSRSPCPIFRAAARRPPPRRGARRRFPRAVEMRASPHRKPTRTGARIRRARAALRRGADRQVHRPGPGPAHLGFGRHARGMGVRAAASSASRRGPPLAPRRGQLRGRHLRRRQPRRVRQHHLGGPRRRTSGGGCTAKGRRLRREPPRCAVDGAWSGSARGRRRDRGSLGLAPRRADGSPSRGRRVERRDLGRWRRRARAAPLAGGGPSARGELAVSRRSSPLTPSARRDDAEARRDPAVDPQGAGATGREVCVRVRARRGRGRLLLTNFNPPQQAHRRGDGESTRALVCARPDYVFATSAGYSSRR